ncbi:MAG: hypothetical protein MZV65_35440 [Chromatiales bacterium]|nr:hypothetical protein [Chromatiales bacterium]
MADTGTNAAPVTASNFEAGKFAGSIDIGSSLTDMQFGVTDSTIIGTDADGILGSDLIEKSGGFDLSNNLLTINPDFAVTFVNGRLLVTIPIKGTKGTENLKFVIDTGAPISLLNTTSSEKIGLTEINAMASQ